MQGPNFWGLRTAAPHPSLSEGSGECTRDTDVCDGSWSANGLKFSTSRCHAVCRPHTPAGIHTEKCERSFPEFPGFYMRLFSHNAQQDSFRSFTCITKPGELCCTCASQCGAVARGESGRPALRDKQSRAKLREEGRESCKAVHIAWMARCIYKAH